VSFASIDHAIDEWASANNLTLFSIWEEQPVRCCYTSSAQGERVQIYIDVPEGDNVTIHVRSIETVDDGELHMSWVVGVAEVRKKLDIALSDARKWFDRRV
jgi:hypothetical protein